METVVATVSGYHGTERFKLIKLIAQTGASYVGAMGRSTTHLVCWKLKGDKYELARKIGAIVISHRWFEDCLMEGMRLPEGPYTLQSGQEAGPILWEPPVNLDNRSKQMYVATKDRNALADQSNVSCFSKAVEKDQRCFSVEYMKSVDSHPSKENSFPSWDYELMGSKNVQKVIEVSEQGGTSCHKEHNDSHNIGLQCRGSSSFPSSFSRQKNLHIAAENNVTEGPARKSRRLMKKYESSNLSNQVISDRSPENCLAKSGDNLETVLSMPIALDDLRSRGSLSSQGINSQSMSSDSEERRIHGPELVETIPELSNCPVSRDIQNSRSPTALSAPETSPKNENCEPMGKKDSCSAEVNPNEYSAGDYLFVSAGMHKQSKLSCVICLTEFSSTRGVLPCGHRFCYSCIQVWADRRISSGKVATCPLCNASFISIRKMEGASSPDQKIYSQTIPSGSSSMEVLMLCDRGNGDSGTVLGEPACCECLNREPAELLVSCHICRSRWVHSYCLDPPLVPWTCIHCRDLRMLYQRFH